MQLLLSLTTFSYGFERKSFGPCSLSPQIHFVSYPPPPNTKLFRHLKQKWPGFFDNFLPKIPLGTNLNCIVKPGNLFVNAVNSNQYDEISNDELSDDEISGLANTTKFLDWLIRRNFRLPTNSLIWQEQPCSKGEYNILTRPEKIIRVFFNENVIFIQKQAS